MHAHKLPGMTHSHVLIRTCKDFNKSNPGIIFSVAICSSHSEHVLMQNVPNPLLLDSMISSRTICLEHGVGSSFLYVHGLLLRAGEAAISTHECVDDSYLNQTLYLLSSSLGLRQ